MPKIFNLKIRGLGTYSLPEESFRAIEGQIYGNPSATNRIELPDGTDLHFRGSQVDSVRSEYAYTAPTFIERKDEVPDEQRQRNLKRMKVAKFAIFNRPKDQDAADDEQEKNWIEEWLEFKKTGLYPKSGWRGVLGMAKGDYAAFQQEFFDIHIPDHEFEEDLCRQWLSYQRGHQDPRDYDRNNLAAKTRSAWQASKNIEEYEQQLQQRQESLVATIFS